MKLLRELFEDVEYVTEASAEGQKNHYIVGPYLVGGVANGNRRMYPVGILEKEVERYTKEIIQERRAYGELGHPDKPVINLERVSHLIKELKQDRNMWMGKAQITETPMGSIALGLMKSGAKLGVSSRGLGSLKPTSGGIMEVQGDFKLATAADIVANPSAPGAFVDAIMESADWVFDPVKGTWVEEALDNTRQRLSQVTQEEREENALRVWTNFLKSLKTI
jgi:hypothetical protein